jgi:hypothetical protein
LIWLENGKEVRPWQEPVRERANMVCDDGFQSQHRSGLVSGVIGKEGEYETRIPCDEEERHTL